MKLHAPVAGERPAEGYDVISLTLTHDEQFLGKVKAARFRRGEVRAAFGLAPPREMGAIHGGRHLTPGPLRPPRKKGGLLGRAFRYPMHAFLSWPNLAAKRGCVIELPFGLPVEPDV